ncbi:hypothetical protein pb186bvf_019770 [Paramecium bursaria]
MAYYYESVDLNLRKKYNNLQYDELDNHNVYQIPEQELTNKQQDEQLVAESEILKKDIRNMCVYFSQRYIFKVDSQQILQFPFIKIKDRVCHIFEKYQEQSSLLDNILEQLVVPLMDVVKLYVNKTVRDNEIVDEFHQFCDTLYILTKVRGVRSISRFCPHQVSDLEPVVMYLKINSQDLNQNWETKYIILMWLSIIVLVPFDLSSIDSQLFEGFDLFTTQNTIIAQLLNLGVIYLRSSTKLRNMGALYLSKLFSRSDVLKTQLLNEFLSWSVKQVQIQDNILNTFYVTGILETLVEVLKTGQREELKQHLNILLPLLTEKQKITGTLINLFLTKLTQRIGLVYLRPRVVNWAYKKGNQNIVSTLEIDHSNLVSNVARKQINIINDELLQIEVVDYFADVDQEALEIVIDTLLQQLTNKDTVVRWSAAKGLGRICSRLDQDQADDVFEALLNTCFTPINGDTAWHGGCLALGELCRRGLIIEKKLEIIIPIICKALIFEQNQGGYSIGVNVRDSACYIAWSAARAYDPEVLKPHVQQLASQLITVMLFDREVNVRRAASSTFQELVGRCPNIIPHGIEILQESDYFALALIHNAYLKIAPYVASFDEYYKNMVLHLAFIKVQSQDKEIRKLAAKSLSRLLILNPQYYIENRIYEGLLDMIQQGLNSKHGSLYALGDLLIAQSGNASRDPDQKELKDSVFLRTLTKNDKQLTKAGEHIQQFKKIYQEKIEINYMNLLQDDIIQRLLNLPQQIESSLKGKQGEMLRIAVNRLLECVSVAQIEITPQQHKQFLKFIDEGLKHPQEDIQNSAVKALRVLSNQYQQKDEYLKDGHAMLRNIIHILSIQNKGQVIISGYAQSVGAFSSEVYKDIDLSILFNLGLSKKRSKLTSYSIDPDTRKYAIKSLGECYTVILNKLTNCDQILIQLIDCLLYGMLDYTINKRGDVGLFIRENSIISLQAILVSYVNYLKQTNNQCIITKEKINQIIGQLLQQVCEKIDRVRLLAGSVLQDLFRQVFPLLPKIDNYDQISKIFQTQYLQEALLQDQERVDQSFQTEIIEAEIKILKERLLNIKKSELIYHWNLPHCCYRLIVPLLSFHNITKHILIGLCISVGGISESIQKFSEQALNLYIQENANQLENLLNQLLLIQVEYTQDERVIIPLYKTLSLILQKEEVHQLDQITQITQNIYHQLCKEIDKTQSINKLSACVQVIVDILQINQELGVVIIKYIYQLLTCEFPKVRKQLADAFYLYLMSADNEEIISTEKSLELQDYLLETDWLSEQLDRHIQEVRDRLSQY